MGLIIPPSPARTVALTFILPSRSGFPVRIDHPAVPRPDRRSHAHVSPPWLRVSLRDRSSRPARHGPACGRAWLPPRLRGSRWGRSSHPAPRGPSSRRACLPPPLRGRRWDRSSRPARRRPSSGCASASSWAQCLPSGSMRTPSPARIVALTFISASRLRVSRWGRPSHRGRPGSSSGSASAASVGSVPSVGIDQPSLTGPDRGTYRHLAPPAVSRSG